MSADIVVLAVETEGEEVEVDVEGETGRCADGREGEKKKRDEGKEPGHC